MDDIEGWIFWVSRMAAVVSMLRGVNVGSHNRIKMDDLRRLYESLDLRDPQTYIQSGNVVFKTGERNLAALSERIGKGIERSFGFRTGVLLRTTSELRNVVEKNPFAARPDIDPSKLLVTFLASKPDREARENVLTIETDPEEMRIEGREVYIYFPNGMGRPRLSWPVIERKLETSGTGRNWNTVLKLLEMAERLEVSG